MINKEIIEEVKNRLVETYNPVAIYVFGLGCLTEESDLELFIIVDKLKDDDIYEQLRRGHRALFGLDISKDIIVYTANEFEKRAKNVSTLCYKIKNEGKVIYARA